MWIGTHNLKVVVVIPCFAVALRQRPIANASAASVETPRP
jgi:hypothetical protein